MIKSIGGRNLWKRNADSGRWFREDNSEVRGMIIGQRNGKSLFVDGKTFCFQGCEFRKSVAKTSTSEVQGVSDKGQWVSWGR